MGKKLLAVVIALVAAQAFSGCYALRELNWDKDKVEPGKATTAAIGLQGSGSRMRARGATEGRFFLAVLRESSEGISFGRPTFDSKDQLGEKEKLTREDALLELAFSQEPCDGFVPFRRGGDEIGFAWTTADGVQSSQKFVRAKLKAKVANNAPGGGLFGIVASGEWVDDGDGVPEDPGSSDDEIYCAGFTTTTIGVKGPAGP